MVPFHDTSPKQYLWVIHTPTLVTFLIEQNRSCSACTHSDSISKCQIAMSHDFPNAFSFSGLTVWSLALRKQGDWTPLKNGSTTISKQQCITIIMIVIKSSKIKIDAFALSSCIILHHDAFVVATTWKSGTRLWLQIAETPDAPSVSITRTSFESQESESTLYIYMGTSSNNLPSNLYMFV